MKKVILALALAASTLTASAATFWVNGVLFGNVCRSGPYYTVYLYQDAQPVGTTCAVRNQWGYVIGYGRVSNE